MTRLLKEQQWLHFTTKHISKNIYKQD